MITPQDLKGWKPNSPRSSSHENLEFVEDNRYNQIAEFFGKKIYSRLQQLSGLSRMQPMNLTQNTHKVIQDAIYYRELPVYLRQNSPKPNGYPSFKRYIQLAPINYHADGCQFYIEVFFEGGDGFDDKNSKAGLLNPYVEANELVLFIGIDCTLQHMIDWNSNVDELDDEYVHAHWDEINGLIHEFMVVDHSNICGEICHFDSDLENGILKMRISLPRQSLDKPWASSLDRALDLYLEKTLSVFKKIGNKSINI